MVAVKKVTTTGRGARLPATVMPAQAGIQYAGPRRLKREAGDYWITRLRG